jgi:hypothetical protein
MKSGNMMTCPIDVSYKPPERKVEIQAKDQNKKRDLKMKDIFMTSSRKY